MKDKHGVEIEVGDTVDHAYGATGIVHEAEKGYFVCYDWSDGKDNGLRIWNSSLVEVIKKVNEPVQQEVFTAEDQAMLDNLLKKKELFESESHKVGGRLQDILQKMYKKADELHLGDYIRSNIDEIIDVLQTYKKYQGCFTEKQKAL